MRKLFDQDQKTSSSALQAINNLASIIYFKHISFIMHWSNKTHHPTKTKWTPSGTCTVHNSNHKVFNIASLLIERYTPKGVLTIHTSFQPSINILDCGGCMVVVKWPYFSIVRAQARGSRLKSLLSFTIVVWLRALVKRAPYKSAKSISPCTKAIPPPNHISRKSP